ncbi:MAG: FG-GAP-like repeat-containing protein [Candidatus Hydrogenedentes bacterium]|nr:FG-GAP-like repeat-containing protein [Candidatus Hydrogenedentota bacterium]
MTRAPLLALLGLACFSAHADTFLRHPKTFRVGPNPSSIATADLNGDGLPDIVTSNRGRLTDIRDERPANDTISYLLAEGPLQYRSQPPLRSGFGPHGIVIENIDALKAPDIIVVNFHAARDRDLTLLRNIGENLFEPRHFSIPDDKLDYARTRDSANQPIFSKPGLTSLIIEDIDHDGYRDAIATGWSADVLVFFPGESKAYFGDPIITELHGGPRDAVLTDFDNDGNFDLAVTLYSTNEIALLRGDGTGAFTLSERFESRGKLPHKIRWVDMNNDAKKDLIVSHTYSHDSIVIFYGTGSFSFPLSQEIQIGSDRDKLQYDIRDIAIADFTGNGRADIALACHEASSVVLLKNVSKGTEMPQSFTQEVYTYKDGRPHALCVGDFNQDGKPDLGVALWGADAVALLLNK